jgi:hypothetical protein
VLVSNEDFSRASREQIARIVDAFGGRERIHVTLAARRLDRLLPSQWQERVKAGDQRPYDEWLRVVLDRPSDTWSWDRRNVWRSHDLRQLVSRWAEHVDEGRIWVIVMDEADRRRLPAAFEELLALPHDTIRPVSSRSNRGLTWGECEIFRGINEAFAERGWSKDVRRRFVRRQILPDLSGRTPPPGPKSPPLPQWAVDTLRQVSAQRVEWLAGSGVEVIGDPEMLRLPDDVETVSGPFPEPPIPRRAVGDVVTALMAATLAAGDPESAQVGDVGFDDEGLG